MSSQEILSIITAMVGGLALFLFGMDTMSDSLGQVTGGVLDKVIGVISKNRVTAFLFGTGVTALVQSSSAITVLSVGLVNAGIIELEKAIGLIIGANLGTTATSWLLSLNALEGQSLLMTLIRPSSFSPFLAILGVGINMFSKSEKAKTAGSALLGFAVMMIGMNMMSVGVSPLKDIPALKNLLFSFSNPILGFMFALLFTMLIQSSDASVGIVQAFALSVGVTFGTAIPLICGAQVGTCITALISSLGTSNNGKRTAFMNLYYNLLKAVPFMVIFYLFNTVLHFGFLQESVGAVGIPVMHTLINLIGAAIWLPGAKVIVALAGKSIPLSREEQEERSNTLTILDPLLLSTPSFALVQAERATNILAETVSEAFLALTRIRKNPDERNTVKTLCKRAGMYHDQINAYLTDIVAVNIKEEDTHQYTLLANADTALGRIGVITLRLLDERDKVYDEKIGFPDEIIRGTYVFGQAINEIVEMTAMSLELKEPTLYTAIQLYREEISRLSNKVNIRYIENLHRQGADHSQSTLIFDIFYEEEKLIDCCDIIADALLTYASATGKDIDAASLNVEEKRRQINNLFRDKYEMLGF